jgi:hypothetical protein
MGDGWGVYGVSSFTLNHPGLDSQRRVGVRGTLISGGSQSADPATASASRGSVIRDLGSEGLLQPDSVRVVLRLSG